MDVAPEGAGHRIIALLKSQALHSIRLRATNLVTLRQLSNVIVVGSSLVGKTTLVDAVRRATKTIASIASVFQVPQRIVTRPQRENDNLVENRFVTNGEFDEMIRCGNMDLHWVRKMEGNREERYGVTGVDRRKIPVFSGNNAIINNRQSVMPTSLVEKSLIIAAYSPDGIRTTRMQQRSPDLLMNKPEEVSYRLSDKAINMYREAHLVIKTFGRYQDLATNEIVHLFRLISEMRM